MTADVTTMIFTENVFYDDLVLSDAPGSSNDLKFESKNICSTNYSEYGNGVNTCRACLAQNDDLQRLIIQDDISEDYSFMFKSCTSLEISWNDRYPKHICNKCLADLLSAYEFWKKCRESLEIWNSQINLLNEKNDLALKKCNSNLDLETNDNSGVASVKRSNRDRRCKKLVDKNSVSHKQIIKKELEDKVSGDTDNCESVTNDLRVTSNDGTNSEEPMAMKSGCRRCKKCNMIFPNKAEYAKHAKYHNKYLCPVCGYFCGSIGGLQAHSASHSELRPYQCNVCNKQYKSQSSLHVHMRNHTGERRYTCEQCGIKFITWNSLNSHIKTHHSTARPYVCEICLKSFKQSSTLKIHRRHHTGEKPYACTECTMAFKSSSDLKGHMVKHTGERNFPCTLCEKRFSKPYNLKQHMVTHTGERRHKCEICERAFTQAHVLRGHMKTHRELQIQITSIS